MYSIVIPPPVNSISNKKTLCVVLVCLMLCAMFAACSGDDPIAPDISSASAGGSVSASVPGSSSDSIGSSESTVSSSANVSSSAGVDESHTMLPITIPAGGVTFIMGSPDGSGGTVAEPNRGPNETQHEVKLTKSFSMGKYQVTQELWEAVMGAGSNPSAFTNNPATTGGVLEAQEKRPVENVSWYDALVFCNALSEKDGLAPVYSINGNTNLIAAGGAIPTNSTTAPAWNDVSANPNATGYRLPTEAEWEYACRAGTTTAYNTGSSISDNTGWYTVNSGNKTHEVGKKPANAWGLYDMHGNVNEWCWDRSANSTPAAYGAEPVTDPTGAATGSYRVYRGGSSNNMQHLLRSAYRMSANPWNKSSSIGFRLVCAVP